MNLRVFAARLSLILAVIGLCGQGLDGQQKSNAKSAKSKGTPEQQWIRDVLSGTQATIYQADGTGSFFRITFHYSDVQFPNACQVIFTEHKDIAATDRLEHDFLNVSIRLQDVAKSNPEVKRYSEDYPPEPKKAYTQDAWLIGLKSEGANPKFPLVLEGHETAERMAKALEGIAKRCSSDH